MRPLAAMDDLRHAFRTLRKAPGYTALAVATLALGIGANTAIYSSLDSLVLRPLALPGIDRLVTVWETNPSAGLAHNEPSPANFLDWRAESRAFERLAAMVWWEVNLAGGDRPEHVQGQRVTPDFFATLGVVPALGRDFLPEEDRPERPAVVLLSHALWRRRFGSDPGIVGRPILVDGVATTVVGVMPPEAEFPPGTDAWTPWKLEAGVAPSRGLHHLRVVGRLAPGATLAEAQAEMGGIAARLAARHPETNTGRSVELIPLRDDTVRFTRPSVAALMGAVGLLLLLTCANLANLTLARSEAHRREVAIRSALGAGRLRLFRQSLAESLLLAAAGGALGLLVAVWFDDLTDRLMPEAFARWIPGLYASPINARTLAFTALVSAAVGVAFGLLPARRAATLDLGEAVKLGGRRAGGSPHRGRSRRVLVATEIALALVLTVAAGLVRESYARLEGSDPGFATRGVLTAMLSLPQAKYPDEARVADFYRQVLERVAALPGVEAAGAANSVPLLGSVSSTTVTVEGRPAPPPGREVYAGYRTVTPGYFAALRIPLLRGRLPAEQDDERAPRVAVVNQAFARRYFPGEDPLGRRIQIDSGPESPWRTVVGVIGDVRHATLAEEPQPEFFLPYRQDAWREMTIVARTGADPLALAPTVRSQVEAVDPDQPVYLTMTMEQRIATQVVAQRVSTACLGAFSALALLLAGLGVFGITSYAVAQRTHEVGVRMALGAERRHVLRLVLGEGIGMAAAGIAAGLAGAALATRGLAALLYGVGPLDPSTFAGATALLAAAALLACWLPARRAAGLDPVVALRHE